MKAYKGFDKDLKCRDFQYEIGKEYEEEKAKLCECGFHACEYPLDCFRYYPPTKSRFCEVELDATDDRHSDDSKVCGSKIKIGAEIGAEGIIKAAIKYIVERTNCQAHSIQQLNKKANSATGYGLANLLTDIECENNGESEHNVCIGWGKDNKCKGPVGCFLILSEWGKWNGENDTFIGATMVEVDGEKIKADTFYKLKNGKIIEAD